MNRTASGFGVLLLGFAAPASAAVFHYNVDLGPASGTSNSFEPGIPTGNWTGDLILNAPPALRDTITSVSVRMTGRYEYDATFKRADGECSEDEPWFCDPPGNYFAPSRTTLSFYGGEVGRETIDRTFHVPTLPLEFSGVDHFDFTVDLTGWSVSEGSNEIWFGSWELFDETIWDFGQTEVRAGYAYSFVGLAAFRIEYSSVPEPRALGLVGLELLGIGIARRRRSRGRIGAH